MVKRIFLIHGWEGNSSNCWFPMLKNNEMKNIPKIGVGVFIKKDGKILLGKRKGSHDAGTWSPPGGHLEFKESLENCSIRETLEEAGIKIKNIKFTTITNDIFEKDNKHYITVFMVADYDSGEVSIKEPDKCDEWSWFPWDDLPSPLMTPVVNLTKTDFNPFS